MDPVVNVLADLITNVGTIITAFVGWLGTVTTNLITNPFIALMFGMGIALLIYKLVVSLVGKASFRRRGKRR